jgi:hypothetical protein
MMLGIAATTVTIPVSRLRKFVFDKYKFNSPSTKRIIFDEASSSQWGIYLSAYNALTKSLNALILWVMVQV